MNWEKTKDWLLVMMILTIIIPSVAFYKGIYRAFDIVKSATFVVLFAILGIWMGIELIRHYNEISQKMRHSVVYSILAFDLALVLSTAFSLNPNVSFLGVYERQLGLIVMLPLTWMALVGIFLLDSEKRRNTLIEAMIWFGAVNGIYGVMQMMGADPFWPTSAFGHRAFGFQGNPDFFGPMLVMTAFLTLGKAYELLREKNGGGAITYLILFAIQTIALVGSMTRGAWVGFGVGFLVWIAATGAALPPAERKNFLKLAIGIMLIGALFFAGLGLLMPNKFPVFSRLKTIFTFSQGGHPIPRLILWRDTLRLVGDNIKHLRLTGIGIEVFRRNFMPYKSLELAQSEPKVNYDDPHNNYLSVLAKMGVLGIIAYLSIFITAFTAAIRTLSRSKKIGNHGKAVLIAGLIAALAGYAANLLTIFDTISTLLFFYTFLAIITSEDLGTQEINWWEKKSSGGMLYATLALILVLLFSSIGIYNYFNLWRADAAFRIGISYLGGANSNPKLLNDATEYLSRAYNIYPYESYYALNLGKALGLVAYYQKYTHQGDYQKTYKLAKDIILSHEKDTWAPENMYLILGFNAYYIGDMREAVSFMEDIFKWDHWFYGAHSNTAAMYQTLYESEHKLEDLQKAFEHAKTAMIVLKYYPQFDKRAFLLGYNTGLKLFENTGDKETIPYIFKGALTYSIWDKIPSGDIEKIASLPDPSAKDTADTLRLMSRFIDIKKQTDPVLKLKSLLNKLLAGEKVDIKQQAEEVLKTSQGLPATAISLLKKASATDLTRAEASELVKYLGDFINQQKAKLEEIRSQIEQKNIDSECKERILKTLDGYMAKLK